MEPWLREVDKALDDEELVDTVTLALRRRWRQSAGRGRAGTPAEVVLRMLVLKHLRNWSYDELEREDRHRRRHCDRRCSCRRAIAGTRGRAPSDAVRSSPSNGRHRPGLLFWPWRAANRRNGGQARRTSRPGHRTRNRVVHERQRWFKQGRAWRAGGEARISRLKNTFGMKRSPYRGRTGLDRCIGWAAIANNLVANGRHQVGGPSSVPSPRKRGEGTGPLHRSVPRLPRSAERPRFPPLS